MRYGNFVPRNPVSHKKEDERQRDKTGGRDSSFNGGIREVMPRRIGPGPLTLPGWVGFVHHRRSPHLPIWVATAGDVVQMIDAIPGHAGAPQPFSSKYCSGC